MNLWMRAAGMLLALLPALPAWAVREFNGQGASGAYYRIAVPDDWQAGGPLVLYQHGLDFSAVDDDPGLGPLRDIALQEGYAIAASGFSQRGWALFRAIDENRELLEIFKQQVGTPGEIVPFGGSMGGLIALKLAEQPDIRPHVKGVLALCPPVAGSRAWDSGFDLRVAYDRVCTNVDNGRLRRGAEPYPWAYNLNDIPDDLDNLETDSDVLRALLSVTVCTGVSLPENLRTNGMRERLARLSALTHITNDRFLLTNIAYSTFVLSDVLRAPDKMSGRNPFGNVGAVYADADIDANVLRVTPQPAAAVQFKWLSDFNGDIGSAIKVMSVHTSGDQLVIPAHQSVLRQRVAANQLVSAVVNEAEPSHCGFGTREGLAAWELLRAWKDGGAKPDVAALQQACLSAPGDDACRYDASYVPPTMDSRVPPRTDPPAIDARWNGNWSDPSRNGEGIALEILPDNAAAVYFFTFAPAGDAASQAWMVSGGKVVPGGIVFDNVQYRPDPGAGTPTAASQPWGRMYLGFSDCNNGELRWEGPGGWGSKTVPIKRLTSLHGLGCESAGGGALAQTSGSWADQTKLGSGFHVEQLDATHTLVMFYGSKGTSPFSGWAVGVSDGNLAQGATIPLFVPTGPRFGDAYDPAALQQQAGLWSLTLKLGCTTGTATLTGGGPNAGTTFPFALSRLTRPAGINACAD
ncbi:hypothetical protein [Tahibacter soli]|uniref:Uncharacterized protein n=1 Tax=Tahibacter soli TaxID=2983605 RepID=A0A9X3YNU5_9GAMM|nr:hypothetical protein [Tahibacter soli]MDC8014178.1 hypothetical protein [Tahibacter soli]